MTFYKEHTKGIQRMVSNGLRNILLQKEYIRKYITKRIRKKLPVQNDNRRLFTKGNILRKEYTYLYRGIRKEEMEKGLRLCRLVINKKEISMKVFKTEKEFSLVMMVRNMKPRGDA